MRTPEIHRFNNLTYNDEILRYGSKDRATVAISSDSPGRHDSHARRLHDHHRSPSPEEREVTMNAAITKMKQATSGGLPVRHRDACHCAERGHRAVTTPPDANRPPIRAVGPLPNACMPPDLAVCRGLCVQSSVSKAVTRRVYSL
jgi:hypothetical protein